MVALKLKTSNEPAPDLFSFPWDTPLEQWPDELAVRLPRGRHRHVVRFVEHAGRYYALKELRPELAQREFDLLTFLKDEGLPVVELVGIANDRGEVDGVPLDAILITRHLTYSLPYLHLFAQEAEEGTHDQLIDALVVLLTRIHLVGVYWGDCSLGNALFRRDAGALVAYLVDTETGEQHAELSDGQRQHDLMIATDNIAGGLIELEAMGKLPASVDPIEVVEQLQVRYDNLWAELTSADVVTGDELWRVRDRLQRLNDLGFDTEEIELIQEDGGKRIIFRPRVVEQGHHRRELKRMTGIDAEENQARRLLSAMRSYGAWLSRTEGREIPEGVAAYRWLNERYEPTIAAIPDELRGRLVDAEIYHQVLDNMWFLSEAAGEDVGIETAVANYVESILPALPDERVVIDSLSPEPDQTS